MAKASKLYQSLLDQGGNLPFRDFQRVLEAFRFKLDRTKGSHLIYVHPDLPRPFPVQPSGKDTKRYQIREFLDLVEAHGLHIKA